MKNKKLNLQPGVLWITGLSGSGKTTISKILLAKLKKKYDNIILLDGDKLRKTLKIKKKGTFNYNQRKKMGLIYAKICKSYLKKDYFVIISVMALIKFVHQWNKKNLINYKDVYLKVPLYILKKRDPKKIYEKFRLKKIKNVAGLDLKYDVPKKPSLQIIWNKKLTPQKITNKIIKKLF